VITCHIFKLSVVLIKKKVAKILKFVDNLKHRTILTCLFFLETGETFGTCSCVMLPLELEICMKKNLEEYP
jgi:hypothetical protein